MLESHETTSEDMKYPSEVDLDKRLYPNKKKKVMIIDDDQDFRLAISEVLVDEGYNVTTAKDGETGLNSLLHQPDLPDLILVDLVMPVKNGIEFRREQLQLDEINKIPVMFLTGHGYIQGETCFLKPFDVQDLIEAVNLKVG